MHEQENVASILSNLFKCNFPRLPTEVLSHDFFQQFKVMQTSLDSYSTCLNKANEIYPSGPCHLHLTPICPVKFGQDEQAQELCFHALAQARLDVNKEYPNRPMWIPKLPHNNSVDRIDNTKNAFGRYKKPYSIIGQQYLMHYLECENDKQEDLVDPCIYVMNDVCQNAPIKAIKTVRLTMETADKLLDLLPNLKIIHLVRDPRATVLSRMRNPTYRAHYSGANLIKEAKVYCDIVSSDLKLRSSLEAKYSDRIYELINEAFMADKLGETRKIYEFLNLQVPHQLTDFLVSGMNNSKMNSTKISLKWKNRLKPNIQLKIKDTCKELFEMINHRSMVWPE